ncbi:5626_t:CDS:2, partial [Acaulospora colombiana]
MLPEQNPIENVWRNDGSEVQRDTILNELIEIIDELDSDAESIIGDKCEEIEMLTQ